MTAAAEHHAAALVEARKPYRPQIEAVSAFTVAPTSLSRASSCLSSIGCWRTFTAFIEGHLTSRPWYPHIYSL